MTIRDAMPRDFEAISRLMRFTTSFDTNAERIEALEKVRDKKLPFLRQVAEKDGQVAGFCRSQRWELPSPVRFVLSVAVEPEFRGQGIGKQLYDNAYNHAVAGGAQRVWIQFEESNEIGKGFAERRGYREFFYMQDLILDLASFDSKPFQSVLQIAQSSGIKFVPFSQLGDSKENRRKLYEMNVALEKDVPNFGQDEYMLYEDWERRILGAHWYDPDGQIIAMDGERWIGLASVGEFFKGTFVNAMTGVLREYRGRQLGLALKLLSIEFARSKNANQIRTQNHGTNAAILAINQKLGYQALPGWYTYEKAL